MEDDPFEVLGVGESATQAEIRSAYHRLAKRHHPDAGGDDAAFSRLGKAIGILSDANLRADALARRRAARAHAPTRDMSGFDDFFRDTDLNGRGNIRRGPRPRRGADVRAEVGISLSQAWSGGSLVAAGHPCPCAGCGGAGTLPVPAGVRCEPCYGRGKVRSGSGILTVDVTCPSCAGSGILRVAPCGHCSGSGQASGEGGTPFTVPPGVEDGAVVTVNGMGGRGVEGGRSGDLLVTVRIERHARFTRRGRDLAMRVKVPVWTAAMGGSVAYEGVDGKPYRLAVPAGTDGGTRFVVGGGGMPSADGPGALFVTLDVSVPDASGGGMREAFEAVRALADGASRQGAGTPRGDAGSGR